MTFTNISEVIEKFDAMKAQHKDALLLFAYNDSYITFDKDAEIVADKCYVVLSRLVVSDRLFCKLHKDNITKHLELLRRNSYRIALCEPLQKQH